MPTFADKKILAQNLEVSGKDVFPVSNSSRGKTGSRIEQVPAAIVSNYTHAFLVNFDSASFAVASNAKNVDLKTFSNPVIIRDAAFIVTKAFEGLHAGADAHLVDSNADGSHNTHFVRTVLLGSVGAEIMNSTPQSSTDEPAETLLIPAGRKIMARFSAGTGKNLNDATAGQALFLLNIIDVNEYINIIPPFD